MTVFTITTEQKRSHPVFQQLRKFAEFGDQSEEDWVIKALSARSKLKRLECFGEKQRDREAEKEREGEYYHSEWPHLSSGGSIFLSALKSDGESL